MDINFTMAVEKFCCLLKTQNFISKNSNDFCFETFLLLFSYKSLILNSNQGMTEILNVPVISPKELSKEIAEISNMMTSHDLLFVYQDAINANTSESILSITEIRLKISGAEKKIKRKVFNVLVECLQNITNHTEIDANESAKRPSVVVLGKGENHFFITTGNLVHNSNAEWLKEKIELLNKLDSMGLKEIYKDTMVNSDFSPKGGAGLGLIDILRKSGNKVQAEFEKVNDKLSFFTMKAIITAS